ncbi:MAG: 3'-5' exonuclease [Methanomassiliicoccaceae archaeon]|jgi:DNA polymerase-3 subunit epsilon|nr:3'-5' exonuclease [Methanomassiliicoccaceae archaeon]
MRKMSTLDDFCRTDVLVIDTETTGLKGAPADKVVDIAVCRVTLGTDKVDVLYSSVVGHDTSKWDNDLKRSWIFENTDLTLEMVNVAPPEAQVIRDVTAILNNANVTSFNFAYDFNKFLYLEPWSLKGRFVPFRCIMESSKTVCKLPGLYEEYKWPKLSEAYSIIRKDDPARVNGMQSHRALSDAVMASYILLGLYRTGNY